MIRTPMLHISQRSIASYLIAVSALFISATGQLQAQNSNHTTARSNEPVTLNFSAADIEAVARTLATLTGRQVVVDPRVKGTITLNTDRPVTPGAAWAQFLSALRLQGFAVVEAAGLYKIVPEADAKMQGGSVTSGDTTVASAGQIATQIFRLQHETANNLVPVLRPLISANNTINVNPGNNSLVITDYTDNLQRMARIIAALDVASATDVEIIPLQHALASDLVPLVIKLMESGTGSAAGQGQTDTSFKTTILAEPRSNAVLLRAANPARVALVKSLVSQLDKPSSDKTAGNIHVVYLRNADATKLAVTLRAALAGGSSTGTTGGPASSATTPSTPAGSSASASTSVAASAQPSTGGQIQADPATNSLIITAPEPQYRQLRAVIDMLDGRRAQVFVESLIAEVNADKAAEFGIQWQGALGSSGNNNIGLIGTNFGSGGNNLLNLSSQGSTLTAAPGKGLNFGIAHKTAGVYVLGMLARFLETSGDGNILSTPNLLTLDNEEAKIVIGQNVPFVTGSYTNNNTAGGTVNPFQTIERKDVGLTLRVKPQISENGTIKMQIFQEVSSVQASSVNSTTGLITNKRSIESSVLVEDGSIVVLGGLLQDEFSGNQDKIPGMGDIPILGHLFKSESRGRKKTNLMVFLRPVVVRDAQASTALALDRYDLMRQNQQAAQPAENKVLGGINSAPVLPEQALPRPAAAAATPGAVAAPKNSAP
jgi:general secretion pathway protein D